MNLFMFYVGGDCGNSNIELHDVRFSIGEQPQDCYDDLRAQWWGIPKSLHVDGWAKIDHADGYDIVLSKEPYTGSERLFFLNAGGYDPALFEEQHQNLLVVAETAHKAIHKTLTSLRHWRIPHKDAIFEIEKVLSISDMLSKAGYHLHLVKAETARPFEFTSKYIRLDALNS